MSAHTARRLLVGVGNAGVSVLDRIAVENPGMKGILVINNDEDSLTSSVVTHRIAISNADRGDLSEGFLAIEEEFAAAIKGASSVTFCGGLGGETGSFLLPALAALAKADGVTTLASVGMPFSFEGRRKKELASAALRKLHDLCDGVAVIENDRLSGGVPSTAAVGEAFVAADRALQSSVLALLGMLSTSGPVKITRADLSAVLGIYGAMTHFAHGSAAGANRLHEALENALKSPLLTIAGKGSALKDVETVLLLLSGPADISFAEVQRAVSEIEQIAGDRCQVKVGVRAENSPGSPLEIFLLAGSGGQRHSTGSKTRDADQSETGSPSRNHATKFDGDSTPEKMQEPAARDSVNIKTIKPVKPGKVQQTQGVLDLETYQRGRFDKSEPTIVAGEDLDIPTFLRKGIKIASSSKR